MPARKARQPTLRGYLNCGQDEANMLDRMRVARRLSTVLLAIMLIQALTGLAFQAAYRDVEWIRTTWFGNDWVTLVVAAPLLLMGLRRTAVGSVQGLLLWLGLIGFALYNYAFYLFGAALNAFLRSTSWQSCLRRPYSSSLYRRSTRFDSLTVFGRQPRSDFLAVL